VIVLFSQGKSTAEKLGGIRN